MDIIIGAVAHTVHYLSEVWDHCKVFPHFTKGMRRLKIEVKVQQGPPPGYGASLPAEPLSTR
jgi:hypothetical protein